jgi:hypothetical protein
MFSIYRSQEALTSLRQTWENGDAAFRDRIVQATLDMDQLLSKEPSEQGEAREGRARVLLHAPVGILFEVDDDRKLVRILRTWTYTRVADRGNRSW